MNSGKISDCTFSGTINASGASASSVKVGGIAGRDYTNSIEEWNNVNSGTVITPPNPPLFSDCGSRPSDGMAGNPSAASFRFGIAKAERGLPVSDGRAKRLAEFAGNVQINSLPL